ncbi:MAG: hypothetical protein ABI874_09730 [Chloroflexota bacterium]
MSEEKTQADAMSWEEHLKAGMDGLKSEMRESFESRDTLNTVRKHGRAAMKEALLAWRSLIDGAIERVDAAEKPKAERVTKIKIE